MSAFSPAIREFLAAPDTTRRLGPYLCKELLDKAGSAPVFKAIEEHAGLSLRDVAVKVFDVGPMTIASGSIAPTPKAKDKNAPKQLAAEKTAESSWQARVMDEARTLCRVQHPNVIRFHTLSTDAKRGLMGLVMEFAEGISVDRQLADIPRGDGARRVALAVQIGINISSALAAAHEAHVVHCNVKPSNIMFTDGTHKLINFGIAASLRRDDGGGGGGTKGQEERAGLELDDLAPDSIGRKASTLEKKESNKAITGTIGYVDPVCLKTTSPPTESSDLYSLGATLYQCLAGDVPAVAGQRAGVVDKNVLVGDAPPKPLAEVAPSTPPALAKLIDSLVSPKREARPRSADAVFRTLERIRSSLAGHERTLPSEERGPFPGLDRYEASDRDVFFGRSAEVAGVIELARTRGLVGVVGLSGNGKSSLTRARVIPAIEDGALGGWPTRYRSVLVTPGTDLMGALSEQLSKLLDGNTPLADHPEAIAQQLSEDVDAKGEGIVILIDQLEEIVTLTPAAPAALSSAQSESRLKALDLLSRLAEGLTGIRVIVVVRRDLLDEVLTVDPHFARSLTRGIQLLSPLSDADWEEVVDQSLEAYGYRFEDAKLRSEVLKELKARGSAMPLAQFGLTRLWAARDKKQKVITHAAFSAKDGGMQGALEHHADATVAKLQPDIPKAELREILLAMTTPEGTRAHVKLDALVKRFGESAKKLVRALMNARLVSEDKEGVTFAHDALLREWALLRGWIEDARDDRLLVAHIERDAARWNESKDVAEVWRKGRLATGLELWKLGHIPLSDNAQSFLRAGHSEEQKVFYVRAGVVFLIVSLIVGGALFYAKESSDRAAQARRDADALAAALNEVKALKRQMEEAAMENAASAALLHDLRKQMAEERNAYGAHVDATLKKVASATSLDGAQKASEELKGHSTPTAQAHAVVPLPLDLGSLASPSAGKAGDTGGPSGSAGAFDQGAIERVVNSRKASVKRTCLERSASTASSTKVTATITIAANGTVQNVTSTGDEPVVGKCIEQQLRSWSFPPPGEQKTVQIPFVFVRQ